MRVIPLAAQRVFSFLSCCRFVCATARVYTHKQRWHFLAGRNGCVRSVLGRCRRLFRCPARPQPQLRATRSENRRVHIDPALRMQGARGMFSVENWEATLSVSGHEAAPETAAGR